jgi:outer membrane protein assembly factor BamA
LKKLLLVLILFMSSLFCVASPRDSAKTARHTKEKKVDWRIVPVLAYAPETSFLFGIGAIAPFKCSYDSITKHSLASIYYAYSLDKQNYVYAPFQIFTKNNNYYLEGEVDYYNYSYYYWGIGEQRVAKELYNVSYPKIIFNAFRKVVNHFYLGLDYYYEKDRMRGEQAGGSLITDTVPGSGGSTTSGVGLDLLYDTRDSVFFPRHGWYIKAISNFNVPQLGASMTYNRIITDISWYHQLSNPVVLALTQHNQFTWGNVPFNQLALVGGSRQIRGYYQGYYRDDVLSYAQAETRINLIGRIGFVVFGTAAFLGNYHTFPESPVPIFAEGVGLRYNYVRKQHINLRADMAFGTTIEYYLTIQESF